MDKPCNPHTVFWSNSPSSVKGFIGITTFHKWSNHDRNLITGSTFGWIFWKRGLLVVIMVHIAFDLVFQVIGRDKLRLRSDEK